MKKERIPILKEKMEGSKVISVPPEKGHNERTILISQYEINLDNLEPLNFNIMRKIRNYLQSYPKTCKYYINYTYIAFTCISKTERKNPDVYDKNLALKVVKAKNNRKAFKIAKKILDIYINETNNQILMANKYRDKFDIMAKKEFNYYTKL